MDEQNDKITRLEVDEAMLQEQIKNLFTKNQRNQKDVEELEQFGRRLCLRIDGVPTEEKETSKDVLQKVRLGHYAVMQKSISQIWYMISHIWYMIEKWISHKWYMMVYDRAHRICKTYNDKGTNKICKSIIVRFSTKVLQFVSQPCITEQWHTGQKRK